ncbi:MAG TPA: indolepyruvate oxidoreductase subunit beta family protein [Steroidobacteraceae bacterium]|nr:indolepyruvate oxidoreductase subunit beta family protein [Steroidobacteraceae bacterium]
MPSDALARAQSGSEPRPLTIAIAALGGQGGGVLSDWLVEVAELQGWIVQATSVPGVAQRTGTTVYYVEMSPAPRDPQRRPVMALMPVPGDVDLVVAAELMEAGRAVVRGLVTPERTTTVASTHRIYGITEKSAMGDGIADANAVYAALESRSKRLISFDMQALADEQRSVISSILFGAIAASGVLPFPRALYEKAITQSGVAVQTNLAGFAAGFERALTRSPNTSLVPPSSSPTTEPGRKLDERVKSEFPAHLHGLMQEGVKRLMDYQDAGYASLYLDRLQEIRDTDQRTQGAGGGYALTAAVARHLALWMSYEDTIRVADLKTRGTRFNRVRDEVKAKTDQIVYMAEFMHPRFDEVCETLPAGLGARLHASSRARRWFGPLFRKGRRIQTAHVGGFLLLYIVSGLRRWRRGTLRYRLEQERIGAWLTQVKALAARPGGYDAAVEFAECQRLVKGYSDTHERGLKNYGVVSEAVRRMTDKPDLAAIIKRLRTAALADEEGKQLRAALSELEQPVGPKPDLQRS